MEPLGTLLFAGCRLPVTRASFRYVSDGNNDPQSDDEVPGWDFDVCTGPPTDPPDDESLRFLLSNGIRFYSESDPIPLAKADDLTGVELQLAEPFDPVSGEVYFTVYLGEHNDVSDLTLRFVERLSRAQRPSRRDRAGLSFACAEVWSDSAPPDAACANVGETALTSADHPAACPLREAPDRAPLAVGRVA
jgi:hypothetical protein